MAEPYEDTRKGRDRAAYMRDYRAGRKKVVPTIEALATRIANLEMLVSSLAEAGGHGRISAPKLAAGTVELTNAPREPEAK